MEIVKAEDEARRRERNPEIVACLISDRLSNICGSLKGSVSCYFLRGAGLVT